MDPQIGDTVEVRTKTGKIIGKIVGTENRDTSRSGNGPAKPFVCVDDGGGWAWAGVDAVESVEPDPTRQKLEGLIDQVGKKHVQKVLGQMA